MTGEEIIKKLEELEISGSDFAYEFDERKEFGLAPIVYEEEGDREGGGDYSCVVRHFTEHDVYIEVTGYYSSYNGTDWDGGFEIVRPVKKTVVVYE